MKNNNFTTLGLPNALALLFVSIMLIATAKLHSQCVDCDNLSTTEGTYSSAIGTNNNANGNFSFVAGENSKANGKSSFSLGQRTNVYDNYGLGIGRYLDVYGSSSLAIGRYLRTLKPESMVIGYGFSETQTLDNNVNRSLMIGFGSSKPTLFVGRSIGVNNTGRVGIGNITSPEAKLHIRADAGEDANLMLQATGQGQKAMLLFNGGPGMISNMDPSAPLQFYAGGGRYLGIHLDGATGNVGIGLDNPSAQLDIGGSLRIRGGSPGAGKVLTSNAEGVATWETPSGGGGGSNWTVSGSNIYRPTGNVGIGTANAQYKLHIRGRDGNSLGQGNLLVQGAGTTTSGIEIGSKSGSGFIQAGTGYPNNLGTRPLFINPSGGKVIIGTNVNPSESFALAVAGKILAEEIKIVLSVPSSDYVFEPDYPLMPLGELEHFVASKKHLPEVPSAEEFSKNGYSIGEMDDLLLRKIEELTLYIIQQQKEIDALKQQMAK